MLRNGILPPGFLQDSLFLVPSSHSQVAVVRVDEGPFPPYQYSSGATVRVPVRIQDTTRQATVNELEMLFRKRDLLSRPPSEILDEFSMRDGWPGERLEILVAPRQSVPVRLDPTEEKKFVAKVEALFPRDAYIVHEQRSASRYKAEYRISGSSSSARSFHLWAKGAIGFLGRLTRRGHPGEYVGEFIWESLLFLKMAEDFFKGLGYPGRLIIAVELVCPNSEFLPKGPGPIIDRTRDWDDYDALKLPSPKPVYVFSGSKFETEVNVHTLEIPEGIITDAWLQLLRDTRGAKMTYEALLDFVKRLPANGRV